MLVDVEKLSFEEIPELENVELKIECENYTPWASKKSTYSRSKSMSRSKSGNQQECRLINAYTKFNLKASDKTAL